MRSSRKCFALLVFLCLSFEALAQGSSRAPATPIAAYTLTFRGDVSRYDTSVNIVITEYRNLRRKMTLADSLVDALHTETGLALATIVEQGNKINTLVDLVDRHERTIAAKDSTVAALNAGYNKLFGVVTAPKKWFQTTAFKYAAGAVGVLIARKTLIVLLK